MTLMGESSCRNAAGRQHRRCARGEAALLIDVGELRARQLAGLN